MTDFHGDQAKKNFFFMQKKNLKWPIFQNGRFFKMAVFQNRQFSKFFCENFTDYRNAKSLMDSKKHKHFFDTNIVFDQPQQSHMVVPDPPPPPLHIVTTAVPTEN